MTYIFPFGKVLKDSRIVLYGAGSVGRQFYEQITATNFCKIVLWLDKCADEILTKKPEAIVSQKTDDYDIVIIAIENETIAFEIKTLLTSYGIPEKKILHKVSTLFSSVNKKCKVPQNSLPDFGNWLRFANAGMLSVGNIDSFEYAIKNLPSENPVIEIGSFCGLSTNIISFYLRFFKKRNKLFTADKWFFENAEKQSDFLEGSSIRHSEYRTFVKETYIRNISFFSNEHLPYTIESFSDDFFELWRQNSTTLDVFGREIKLGGNISFAYIDGNHTYEYAKRDFENVDANLEKGGFILFDDSSEYSGFEVYRVIKEIISNGRYIVVNNNPNYLIQKLVDF